VKIVYAKEPRVIAFGGMRVGLRTGEPWDGDDPLVEAHPDAFVDGPRQVRSTQDPSGFREVPAEEPAPAGKRGAGRPKGQTPKAGR
jgi:hypothetical protein